MSSPDLPRSYSDWPVVFAPDIRLVRVISASPDGYFGASYAPDVETAIATACKRIPKGAQCIEEGGLSGGSVARRLSEQEEMEGPPGPRQSTTSRR